MPTLISGCNTKSSCLNNILYRLSVYFSFSFSYYVSEVSYSYFLLYPFLSLTISSSTLHVLIIYIYIYIFPNNSHLFFIRPIPFPISLDIYFTHLLDYIFNNIFLKTFKSSQSNLSHLSIGYAKYKLNE